MESTAVKSRAPVNPWLIILLTAPIPLFVLTLAFINWYHHKADSARMLNQLIQRQNKVIAYDSFSLATDLSDFLEKAQRDVQMLALMSPTPENFKRFYLAQTGNVTQISDSDDLMGMAALPFYNRIAFWDNKGSRRLALKNGKVSSDIVPLSQCDEGHLCDHALLRDTLQLPVGSVRYGKLLRWYTPEGVSGEDADGSLSVAYRGKNGVYVVGLDYRQLKDILTIPAFPYEPKHNLLKDYVKGNYIYVVDSHGDVIIHPKSCDVIGIDPATGQWVTPMRVDSEEGSHPVNLQAYQSGILREYFDRLLKKSFISGGVDIFQAPNLAGTLRVVSVAPILLTKGQYHESGIFGHVIVGCNIDHFQEPREKIIPYY